MNNFRNIFISLCVGAFCFPVFFFLYGIVATFDVEKKYLNWIFNLPKEYQLTAGLFHSYLVEMIAATPIVLIAGVILGVFVKIRPTLYGFIAAVGFFLCETIYSSVLLKNIGFYRLGVNIWYTIASISSWFLLFVLATKIGTTINCKFTSQVTISN